MPVVYVKKSCGVGHKGRIVNLSTGQAWDADAELVRAYPDLFEDEPSDVAGRVESATAAPGEVRVTPRRPKKSASKAES